MFLHNPMRNSTRYQQWLQRRDPELFRQLQAEARDLQEMQWLRNAWQGAKGFALPATLAAGAMLGGPDGSGMTPYAQSPRNINYTVNAGSGGLVGNQAGMEQDIDTKGTVQVGQDSEVVSKGGEEVQPGMKNMTVTRDDKGRVSGTWDGKLGMATQRPELFQGGFLKGRGRVDWRGDVRKQFDNQVKGQMNKLVPGSGEDLRFGQEPETKEATPQEYQQMRKQAHGQW